MDKFFTFLQTHFVVALDDDKILSENCQFFTRRKTTQRQNKYSSLTFSSEVHILIALIKTALERIPCKPPSNQRLEVTNNLFSLLFFKLPKIWSQQTLYLFPYTTSRKSTLAIQQSLRVFKSGYNLIFDMVWDFIRGRPCF